MSHNKKALAGLNPPVLFHLAALKIFSPMKGRHGFRSLFIAQPQVPDSLQAGVRGWAVND
jgi:hypothetical protein